MTLGHAPDFVSFSELRLLRSLMSQRVRPNLLVQCNEQTIDTVVEQITMMCALPLHTCLLPGPLTLPLASGGTLLMHDVASLTIDQQVILHDWTGGCGDVQIVSVTAEPLWSLVEQGRFLEGLFYRLNTIRITAIGAAVRRPMTPALVDLGALRARLS